MPHHARSTSAIGSSSSTLNTLLIGVIVVAAMYFAREVLIPVALAGVLSFMLSPPVQMLQRLHLPRALAVIIVALVAFAAIVALGPALVLAQMDVARDLLDAEKLEAFKATVESLFADIAHEHRLLRKESAAGKDPQAGRLPILRGRVDRQLA